mmetsp:Transcript_11952/g.33648  ORF Transcript_11952/g.33648 Transcript_11952/m.33648 type:complete len:637 (+) Transcript_11952:104-2014(+)|eukprot:CAMPEP_0119119304 /NCGR_PEP_ID=MMETSP1310-20130426/840_1 /TAXON_ID=464262 /ORGANISM="Genus nov. species nov., Strain RCC2339" /LENGTH=636 /DNA_ID=CAMNT_0007108729 /DNA_START=89 /DNA_END=1999 /DNA_ORIENTATION=-
MAEGYGGEKVNPKWVEVQKKAFTRWMNQFLSTRMLKVESLDEDLKDGTKLIALLEIISAKPFGRKYNKKPRMQMQMQENLNMAIAFIGDEGLKLVNVGSSDIYNGNTRIILGLIWTLILRYQIQSGIEEGSPKWLLLEWVKKQVKPYGVEEPKNFTTSWTDGQVLSALTDSLKPGVLDMSQTNGEEHPVEDLQRAQDIAKAEYEILPLIDAPDMHDCPDEHSIMTYVSFFRDWLENEGARRQTPNAANTTASGPGVEGGRAKVDNPFTIHTKNQYGDAVTVGGHTEAFHVSVEGPDGPVEHAPLTDNGDGTYSSSYNPAKSGNHKVQIAYSGADISGSPFTVLMEGANAGNTWADGPGLAGGKTGRDLPFTIHGVDADGNNCSEGGEPYEVNISGPDGNVEPKVTDNGDGTVGVVYNVSAPGDYKIDVGLHGQPIKDSPWNASVKAAPDASKSYAEGPGLEGAFDNEPAYFTVFAKDVNGNPVSGDDCQVTVDGPGDAGANVTDNGDGTYAVEYHADEPGDYTINATLDGESVKNTPTTVKVTEGADAENVSIQYTITVHAKNKKGEPKTVGGDNFEVNIKGGEADETDVDCKAVDNGDGTYSAHYELSGEAGTKFKVNISLNGKKIKGSPFKHQL